MVMIDCEGIYLIFDLFVVVKVNWVMLVLVVVMIVIEVLVELVLVNKEVVV